MSGADLRGTDLSNTKLNNTIFTHASIDRTIFGNVGLSTAKDLEIVYHSGPSSIGIDTIYRSQGRIPESLLRGAGVDDTFIEYTQALVQHPFEYYSCFISYSTKDQQFAEHLYADLQSRNVRCWFAPHNMRVGDKNLATIDNSIRVYEKLLLVLSEDSLLSTLGRG